MKSIRRSLVLWFLALAVVSLTTVGAILDGVVRRAVAGREKAAADLIERQLELRKQEELERVEQALIDLTSTQGAPPEDVATMIVDAIRTEQFLVPTKPSYAKQLRDRCDALVDKALPPMPDFD